MNFIDKKIFACSILLSMHLANTTVEWSGTSCPDVTDEDIIINGDCQLQEGFTLISANTANITITVPNDTVISGIDSFDESSEESQIELATIYPYTITIIVKKKLTFKGTPCIKTNPLIVTATGNGSIRWIIEEDGKLSFTADDNGGSAELWTELRTEDLVPFQSIVIHKKNQVHFGERSKWGYRLNYCASVEAGTVIEHHHNTFIKFEDLSSFALEAY